MEELKMEELKTCSRCGKTLPLKEFYKRKNSNDGHDARCKDCKKQYNAEHRVSGRLEELEQYTNRQLLDELKHRGFSGNLRVTTTVNL